MNETRILSFEDIVNADDTIYETVPTPEWGKDTGVRIKSLSGEDREKYSTFVETRKNDEGKLVNHEGLTTNLLFLSMVDEAGKRLMTITQIDQLKLKNGKVLNRIADHATKLSKLGAESIEDAKGNSDAEPTAESGTTSQVGSAAQSKKHKDDSPQSSSPTSAPTTS